MNILDKIEALRLIKSESEIEIMRKAGNISANAFTQVIENKRTKEDRKEKEEGKKTHLLIFCLLRQ